MLKILQIIVLMALWPSLRSSEYPLCKGILDERATVLFRYYYSGGIVTSGISLNGLTGRKQPQAGESQEEYDLRLIEACLSQNLIHPQDDIRYVIAYYGDRYGFNESDETFLWVIQGIAVKLPKIG